ncbi:MAG: 3-deoxy-manno-octulosonate cytidylyltransferase [Rickettsiales bacterium]|nr:3-deoxy-manno-octulosonate cytidylyltransferase [Rickettsiales bacterium]
MQPIILIPARYGSTRLPGKPLADIAGKPMIVRVWEQTMASKVGRVVVATDDQRIVAAIEAVGGEAVMTHPDHPSGSDRLWEALQVLDPQAQHKIVINVQGDVPTLASLMVQQVAELLTHSGADLATLVCRIQHSHNRENPAVVKAIISWNDDDQQTGRALYFTRATAPWGEGELYHHIGIYAYRREALARFVTLPPSPLEMREKLEQLRALEAGMRMAVARVEEEPKGIDTYEQLEEIRRELS